MLEQHSLIAWIQKHNILTEDGSPYNILPNSDHFFMYDILREMSQLSTNLVIYKAAQIGFSTAAIIASQWIAKYKRVDIIYTLPTANDVKDFAGGKINRIIAQNAVLGLWTKDRDTVEQKTVGDNIIYYRGTFTQKAAMMVSSDLNIYDEVDASDQRVIEQYSTRLQASDVQLEWFFSHPSVPGNGVSKHWELSDQKHWFIKCNHCEQEQYMSWPDSFDMEKQVYICKACKEELSDEARRRGRWVAKYKDKKFSGYWIPLFICPWVTAKKIIEYHNEKSEVYFYNKVLGLPYVGSGNKPTYTMITKNLTPVINEQKERIVIGVDTGIKLHYVVGNKDGLFYFGETEKVSENYDPYNEIESLLKRWPRSIAVFDQGGDLIGSRKLRAKYPGRVFLCNYVVDRKTLQLLRWSTGKELGNVLADRNRMIQLLLDEFNDGKIPLQGNENDWWDYWLHWNNIFRTQKENRLGMFDYSWERSGADHWVHASVYWRAGMDRFGHESGMVISKDEPFKGVAVGPTVMPNDTIAATKPRKFNFNNLG